VEHALAQKSAVVPTFNPATGVQGSITQEILVTLEPKLLRMVSRSIGWRLSC
jgi:hypothetical protein